MERSNSKIPPDDERIRMAHKYGPLPENAPWDDIERKHKRSQDAAERSRVERARELGLSEEATWDDIYKKVGVYRPKKEIAPPEEEEIKEAV